jgi:putative SOS response-associated peptidase YedK
VCVRYTLHDADAALSVIAKALGAELSPAAWRAGRYNVALATVMPVVAEGSGKPEVRGMMWGLVAPGGKDGPRPRLLPNARAETVAALPAFRRAVERRRCLVPANGFYEWRAEAGGRQPHLFTLRDSVPFAFAGIWEPADDRRPETYSILTTTPNEIVAPIHDRMPVILTGATMARWLGSGPLPDTERRSLTQPLEPGLMTVVRVSRFVNSTRNEGPQCHAPAEDPLPELDLGL